MLLKSIGNHGWTLGLALATSLAMAPLSVLAMSLEEALAIAYDSNPELAAGRAQLQATDERVAAARAGMRPTVIGTVDYGLRHSNSTGPMGREINTDPFSAGVRATQPLYDGGQTINSVRARIADVFAARARLVSLEQNILLGVVTSYIDIIRDEENVDLARNNVLVIAEQLRASEDRFEVGEVTRTDVSQARARLAEAEARLSVARGQLEVSRQRFEQVVGVPPVDLVLPDTLPPMPQTLEDALALALDGHPELAAARFDARAAGSDVRAAIGALLPSVDLVGNVSFSDTGVFENDSSVERSAALTVQATVPFYQAGTAYSGVRRAQALASAARTTITSEARERERGVENAWTQLSVARANIRSQRQRVAAAQLAFEGVREEALVGSRTTLDVLDAEQELLDARVGLISSIRDEYVSAYELVAAIGLLTVAALDVDAVPYDPTISFERNNDRLFGFDPSEDTVWEQVWRP